MFNEEKRENEIPNLSLGCNLLRQDQKAYNLPSLNHKTRSFLDDGSFVELYLLDEGAFSIGCYEYPIRFGKHFGNRIFLNIMYDRHNINPKFIFDAEKRQWVLTHVGYVCFAEQEIEHKSNHKLYWTKDA